MTSIPLDILCLLGLAVIWVILVFVPEAGQ